MAWRIASPRMIGRGGELADLAGALQRSAEGAPAVAVVSGEAGVGKSRLIRELSAAAGDDVIVLRGECVPFAGAELPYAPVVAALRGVVRARAPAVLELPAESRRELSQLLPELAAGDDPAPPEHDHGPYAQARLFELLLGLVQRLSETAPVLAILEDLHWADRSTLDLVGFLAHNVRDERLMLALTYRTDELEPTQPLQLMIADLARLRHATYIDLKRLGHAEVAEQIAAIRGEPVDPDTLDAIYRRSGGNAFFTEVLLASDGEEELPPSLRDALLARLQSLSEPTRRLVRVVAVIGRAADHELVAATAGVEEPALTEGLREAVGQHVLTTSQGRFAFRHALMREAVEKDLLPGERVALHRVIAEALTALPDAQPAELALHWREAREPEQARVAFIAAGAAARAVHAHGECLRHLEAALQLGPVVGADRLAVLPEATDAALLAGAYERAEALAREALGVIDADADPYAAAQFHERMARARFWDLPGALAEYETALRLLPAEHVRDRARLVAAQTQAYVGTANLEQARRAGEEAVALAQTAGAPAEEATAKCMLGIVVAFLGEHDEGEAILWDAQRLADAHASPAERVRVRMHLAEVMRLRGRLEDALAVTVEGIAIAGRHGLQASLGRFMTINAAEDLFKLGRWNEADERLAEVAGLPVSKPAQLFRDTVAGQLAAARGDVATATRRFDDALAICGADTPAEGLPAIYAAKAELVLDAGHADEAMRIATAGLAELAGREDELNTPALYIVALRALADVATRARSQGDDVAAERAPADGAALFARLQELVGDEASWPPTTVAAVAACRAELARVAGDDDVALWQVAATAWEAVTQPHPAAYAQMRLAEALAATDRPVAAAALRQSGATARRLGAGPLLGEVVALARRARISLDEEPIAAPPAAADAFAAVGLTPREFEVLELLDEGLSNDQIGERLFISKHTAGVHVSRILTKLHVNRREKAAAVARRLGLLSRDERGGTDGAARAAVDLAGTGRRATGQ